MSVVVFPIPLGAKYIPFAPGVWGKGSGGFLKFQLISAGLFSIPLQKHAISVKATWTQFIVFAQS